MLTGCIAPVLACQALAGLGYLGGGWPLELFTHWLPLGGLASLLLLVPALWLRRWALAFALALSGTFAIGVLGPWIVPSADPAPPSGDVVRVAVCNLCEHNGDPAAVVPWLAARDPDVVALLEFEPASLALLAELVRAYPHAILHPQQGPLGFALLSRWPILDHERFRPGIIPQLEAVLAAPGGNVRVLLAHPYAHVTPYRHRASRRTLEALARRAGASDLPVILAGDLNLTPWSPSFHAFLRTSGLRDPRIGRGLLATWPVLPGLGVLDPLGVPIDHVLASPAFVATALERGPANGSDHLPVLATLVRASP